MARHLVGMFLHNKHAVHHVCTQMTEAEAPRGGVAEGIFIIRPVGGEYSLPLTTAASYRSWLSWNSVWRPKTLIRSCADDFRQGIISQFYENCAFSIYCGNICISRAGERKEPRRAPHRVVTRWNALSASCTDGLRRHRERGWNKTQPISVFVGDLPVVRFFF